ncbi:MAG: hypothetical protein WC749_08490 [Dehalococcoidia bacterium]
MAIIENLGKDQMPVIPEGKKRISMASLSKKMERLKKLRILASPLLVIGIFIIIYVGFGTAYYQKQANIEDVKAEISLRETLLKKPASTSNLEEAQNKLAQAAMTLEQKGGELALKKADYSSLALSLPGPEQSLDIYNEIVGFGAATKLDSSQGVEIKDISSSVPVRGKNTDITISYSLTVDGSRDALLDFISRLITSQKFLYSMELKKVDISSNEDSGSNTLTLDLDIYTRPDPASGDNTTPPALEKKK